MLSYPGHEILRAGQVVCSQAHEMVMSVHIKDMVYSRDFTRVYSLLPFLFVREKIISRMSH